MTTFRVSILMILLSMWLIAAMPTSAIANTITVDAFPGEPGCDILDAVRSANEDAAIGGCLTGSNADEILISGSHSIEFAFDNPGPPSSIGDAALPTISSDITITGVGGSAGIRRATTDTSNRFRVINLNSGQLTLNNLTIQGGDTDIPGTSDDSINRGGGIYVLSGSLVLNNCSIINNFGGSFGGGIYTSTATNVEIIDSVMTGNIARGGAAFLISNTQQPILIEGSTISNNATRSNTREIGGAFFSDMIVKRSAIINNLGGGLDVFRGSLAMSDSTVSGNAATQNDSSFFETIAGIGLWPDENASLSILNSTIVNNPPQNGQVGQSIQTHGIRIIAPDSTTTQSLSVILRNNIISANGAAGATRTLQGTEIQVFDDFENLDVSLVTFGLTNNIIGFSGVDTGTALNNVVINPSDNQILTSNSGNSRSLNSIVNPLDDYGGPTMSHTLPRNSPAINNGTEGFFTFSEGLFFYSPGCRGEFISIGAVPPFRADQRNLSRPVGGACDVGSTEFRSDDIIDDESCFVVKAANDNVVAFCL